MSVATKFLRVVRDLHPVFWVAVVVAVGGTLGGSLLQGRSPVVAEDSALPEVKAAVGPGGNQTLKIEDWGVQVGLPYVTELPQLSYAKISPDSVGLTSGDLAKQGPQCSAGKSGLGSITRYAAGTFGTTVKMAIGTNLVATIGEHDYVYQIPHNECSQASEASANIINRETSILLEGLGALTPVTK